MCGGIRNLLRSSIPKESGYPLGQIAEIIETNVPQSTVAGNLNPFIQLSGARGWLTDCLKHHEKCAESFPRTLNFKERRLHLIDPETKCIVETDGSKPYAALSYV